MTTSPPSISLDGRQYLLKTLTSLKDLKDRCKAYPLTVDNYCATNVLSACETFLTTFQKECLQDKFVSDIRQIYGLIRDSYLEDNMHMSFVYTDRFFSFIKMLGNYISTVARKVASLREVNESVDSNDIVISEAFDNLIRVTNLFSYIPPLVGHQLFYTRLCCVK